MEKITHAEIFNAIEEAMANGVVFSVGNEAVQGYIDSQREQRAKKLAKDKERRAEKAAQADELKSVVADALTDELQTVDAIVNAINDPEVTKGKVVNRLTKLIEEGVAVKDTVKTEDKKSHTAYRLA